MNNPPVFPIEKHLRTDLPIEEQRGMTLRDYFAAKAMQEFIGVLNSTDGTKKAYEWADAMLKAREQ
jgi:hypothetical protein